MIQKVLCACFTEVQEDMSDSHVVAGGNNGLQHSSGSCSATAAYNYEP